MMTNTEFLRRRIEEHTRVVGDKTESLEDLLLSEWCPVFEIYMRNRLLMGRFRYGKMNDPSKDNYNCLREIVRRTWEYFKTGNLEYLVDIANFALVEFVHSKHPKKHFHADDDGIHAEPMS